MISPEQSREARKLLAWSQLELAIRTDVAQSAISRFELEQRVLGKTIEAIQRALEAAGVEFTDGKPGVELRAMPAVSVPDPGAPEPGEGMGDAEAG